MALGYEQCESLRSCAVPKDRNGKRKGRARNGHWWTKRETARKRRRDYQRLGELAPKTAYYRGYEY